MQKIKMKERCRDGVTCVVLCTLPSIYLVCVVFGTAIPTSFYIFGKCFSYLYIRESIARVWNGANAPIVHMILQPSKLANTRVLRYCHAISGPGQKWSGGPILVAKTGPGGPSLAAKSGPGTLLLAAKSGPSVPKVVRG